jgi:hypothetical protein
MSRYGHRDIVHDKARVIAKQRDAPSYRLVSLGYKTAGNEITCRMHPATMWRAPRQEVWAGPLAKQDCAAKRARPDRSEAGTA